MSKHLRTIMQSDIVDPWEALASEVVRQAVEDYKYLQKIGKFSTKYLGSVISRKEIEKFFLSEAFCLYTDLDGKEILRILKGEIK